MEVRKFQTYLRSEGIRHECTIPKTPEQNGVAERFNCTVVEATRLMLLDARPPQKFWAEAISTAMYVPTKPLSYKSYWHNAVRSVAQEKEHLRVFGCAAYVHIPRDEHGKLDSKANKCIFLGYGEETKGYRLYHPVHQKVLHSRVGH